MKLFIFIIIILYILYIFVKFDENLVFASLELTGLLFLEYRY